MKSRLKVIPDEKPWYSEGLHFSCTECGKCCTGSPGYVWLTENDMNQIAHYLQIPLDEFVIRFVRKVGERFSLRECSKTFDCVFLEGKKCTIYPVRPKQCRAFPWWPQNVRTPEDWKRTAIYCEGIRADAPKVDCKTIQQHLESP